MVFIFFSPFSEGWGYGGIARSTQLSGKRFCGDRQWNRKGGGGIFGYGALGPADPQGEVSKVMLPSC